MNSFAVEIPGDFQKKREKIIEILRGEMTSSMPKYAVYKREGDLGLHIEEDEMVTHTITHLIMHLHSLVSLTYLLTRSHSSCHIHYLLIH